MFSFESGKEKDPKEQVGLLYNLNCLNKEESYSFA